MPVTLNIPSEVEEVLRQAWGGELDRAALEALAIEGYRSRRFGVSVVRLGLESRWDAEHWLGAHGVEWNYTMEDFEEDRKTMAALFPEDAG